MPLYARYIIRKGVVGIGVGTMTRVMASGKYVGEEMMLTDHIREHAASSMGYLDAFRLNRADVFAELDSGRFPLLQRNIRRRWLPRLVFQLNTRAVIRAIRRR